MWNSIPGRGRKEGDGIQGTARGDSEYEALVKVDSLMSLQEEK